MTRNQRENFETLALMVGGAGLLKFQGSIGATHLWWFLIALILWGSSWVRSRQGAVSWVVTARILTYSIIASDFSQVFGKSAVWWLIAALLLFAWLQRRERRPSAIPFFISFLAWYFSPKARRLRRAHA